MKNSLFASAACLAVYLALVVIPGLSFAEGVRLRVPKESTKPGTPHEEPWANVPVTFPKSLTFPEWQVPDNLETWEREGSAATLETVLELLGEMPPRPTPPAVKSLRTEDRGNHTAEYLELDNGFDMTISGLLLVPKALTKAAPAILVMHGWGGDKDSTLTKSESFDELVGPMLVEKGFVVAAIDGYFHGDRIGKGPNDLRDVPNQEEGRTKQKQQHSLFAINLWFGRSLWGMMLREQQCMIDYLQTRPDVDPGRIGATGMSLGNTTAWWLAAIDPRVVAVVGVACFTRYEQLIEQGFVQHHGIYYFVPGMLQHFDTEAIFSMVAPRPMLQLNGDSDPTCPLTGIEILEEKVGSVYKLHGAEDDFASIVFLDTGHFYHPQMKERMVAWFLKYLQPPSDAAEK